MNNKSRVLELYSIKWEYDKSAIDETFYNKLDDTVIEENDMNYQRQFKGKGSVGLDPSSKVGDKVPADKKGAVGGKAKTSSCSIF
jgi:hypothetical protein